MKNILLIASIFLSATSSFSKIEIEKVIDDNDLVTVDKDISNIPFRYKKIMNAIGVVQYEQKNEDGKVEFSYACTGTHLGGGYVITAGHCVGASKTLSSQKDCSFIEKNPFMSSPVILSAIDFGYRDQVTPFMRSNCQEIVAALKDDDAGFDFAILKVSPYPEEFILPDITRRSILGDTVTIFSHPNGEALQWSKSCGVERVLRANIPGTFIQHQCDTKPGSSGAAIINVISLKVVGIHDGGFNDEDPATGLKLTTGMNYGTYILNSPLYDVLIKLGF